MFRFLILIAMSGIFASQSGALSADEASMIDVWIGTSARPPSKGIYHCQLDRQAGKLTAPRLVAEISGPGFLAMHPRGTHLYAVGTLDGVPGVVAYRIDRSDSLPQLELANALPIGDGGACHVAVDSQGRTLLTAQYGGGSVAAFELSPEGDLKRQTALHQHQGASGVVASRQSAPHAHWVGFSPDERFAFVPDLGLDQVLVYRHDADAATIEPHGSATMPPGGGPRHMKFHPNGNWAYVLNELSVAVTVCDYNAKTGELVPVQTVAAVPQTELDRERAYSSSEIRVHPNGQFVYSANRGHDTISVFKVNPENGHLSLIEYQNIRAATPRNFNLDPSGRWLLAAGQDSHTVGLFGVDADSGRLTYQQQIVQVPAPICVLFEHE